MSDKPITLTNDNFEQVVLNSSVPVVVDFWAPWCGPCRVVGPMVESLAEEFSGLATISKLNIDDYDRIATEYHIQAIPTLLFFQNGRVIDQVTGVTPKATLVNKLTALLADHNAVSQVA
jgi:thioredoxin 1